ARASDQRNGGGQGSDDDTPGDQSRIGRLASRGKHACPPENHRRARVPCRPARAGGGAPRNCPIAGQRQVTSLVACRRTPRKTLDSSGGKEHKASGSSHPWIVPVASGRVPPLEVTR